MSIRVWAFLASRTVEHLRVDLGGLGFVVGVQHAADAQLAFGVEVSLAPLAVRGAGLVGVLVVVQDEGGQQHVRMIEVEGLVPAGDLVQPAPFVAGEQVKPGRDGVGVAATWRNASGPARSGVALAPDRAVVTRSSGHSRTSASWSRVNGAVAVASALSTCRASRSAVAPGSTGSRRPFRQGLRETAAPPSTATFPRATSRERRPAFRVNEQLALYQGRRPGGAAHSPNRPRSTR